MSGATIEKIQAGIKVDPSGSGAAVATIENTLLNGSGMQHDTNGQIQSFGNNRERDRRDPVRPHPSKLRHDSLPNQTQASPVPAESPARSPRVWTIRVLLLLAGLAAWYGTRVPTLRRFRQDQAPQPLASTSYFLSASVGGSRPVGQFSPSQLSTFEQAGGFRPALHLDIRAFPEIGPNTVLSRVDPGICWIFHVASLLGMPLSIAGIATFHHWIDFLCLWLAALLAFRLWGPIAAGLTTLFYGANASIPYVSQLVSYYFWGVPFALTLAHIALFVCRRSRPRLLWWSALVAAAMFGVWLRVLWLPVLLAFLPLVSAYAYPRRKLLVTGACVVALALSYVLLLRRVGNEGLGDVLHPRSQLWHTLYIGLGAYGDWGDIQWLDEYGYGVAAAAGISAHDSSRYDGYLRTRFIDEVARRPFKYAATIVRRTGDYVDGARASMKGAAFVGRRSWLGWIFLALVGICFVMRRREHPGELAVAALYVLQVGVWSPFVPPVSPYPVETMGLAGPLFAGVLVVLGRLVADRTRRWSAASRPTQGQVVEKAPSRRGNRRPQSQKTGRRRR